MFILNLFEFNCHYFYLFFFSLIIAIVLIRANVNNFSNLFPLLINRDPSFDLIGLTAGYEYEVNLYAVNSKGRSLPYTMTAFTLKSPEKHTDLALSVTTAIMQKREVLMMVAGSVVGIIVIALLITIVAKIRGGSNARGLEMKSMAAANHLPASAMPNDCNYGHNMDQLQELEADKNPDIIPPHTTTLEEWQEAVANKQQLHQQQIYGSMHFRIPHQQAIAMHQQQQPQPAAAYNTANANGMIIYSGATLARPHMNNNFKRIDSNGIFHNSTIQQVSTERVSSFHNQFFYAQFAFNFIHQFDLASPPPSLQQQFYIQQQQQQQGTMMQQPTLLIASCPGAYPPVPSPLTVTGLNTATLDRFQTPPSPSLFVSSSSTNPICSSSNEPVRSFHEIYCYRFHIAGLLALVSHFLISTPAIFFTHTEIVTTTKIIYLFFPSLTDSDRF